MFYIFVMVWVNQLPWPAVTTLFLSKQPVCFTFSCLSLFTYPKSWFINCVLLSFLCVVSSLQAWRLPFPLSLEVRRRWDNVLCSLCPQQAWAAGQNLAGGPLGQEAYQGARVRVQPGEQRGEHHLTQGKLSGSQPSITSTVIYGFFCYHVLIFN